MKSSEGLVYERVERYGVSTSSMNDLLAVAVSRRPSDADENHKHCLELFVSKDGLFNISNLSCSDLADRLGLDRFEALRVLCAFEAGRRSALSARGNRLYVDGPDAAFELLKHYSDEKREHFIALLIDAKGRLLREFVVHVGTLTASLVGTREVFREAVRDGACRVIVAHNHPSGDPEPSQEDIAVTKRLAEAAKLLDIELDDHIIIGRNAYTSLRKRGVL